MKRLLKAQFYALRCHFWLPLALLAAGLVVGAVAGSFVRDTVLSPYYRLAVVLENRRALPFLGGCFVAVWFWLSFSRGALEAPLARGLTRRAVFTAALLPLLLALLLCSLLSQLAALLFSGLQGGGLPPAAYVLPRLGLRLLEDLLLCLVPLCFSFLLRESYAAPLLAAAWGLLLWLRLPLDLGRWMPDQSWRPLAWWPLPAAAASVLLSRFAFRQN